MGSRSELLQGVQGKTAYQMDVAGVHKLQTVHNGQRCLDVWRMYVGDIDDGREAVSGD